MELPVPVAMVGASVAVFALLPRSPVIATAALFVPVTPTVAAKATSVVGVVAEPSTNEFSETEPVAPTAAAEMLLL